MTKSPILIDQDFLPSHVCDQILNIIVTDAPALDDDGRPVPTVIMDDAAQALIFEKLKRKVPEIENHFGVRYKGTEKVKFQQFGEGFNKPAEAPCCQNSKFLRRKWVKVADVDLTALIWLVDHVNDGLVPAHDQISGGKLEFPQYDFSLLPQKGTLILYPAGPHFITAVSPVLAGTLYQARVNLGVENGWLYQPEDFPGTWQDWMSPYI